MIKDIDLLLHKKKMSLEEKMQINKIPYLIICAECGNKSVVCYYDANYNGYLAYCDICDTQWKMS